MNIIPAAEFYRQASSDNPNKKTYQNRVFIASVVFAIKHKEAAINYCQLLENSQSSCSCILVEDVHHIQVWYEKGSKKDTGINSNSTAANNSNKLVDNLVDQNFIANCDKSITESIGPIAKIVIQKILSSNKQMTRKQFLKKLFQELPPEQQTQDIKQKIKQLFQSN